MTKIEFKKIRENALIKKAFPEDAGYDITASLENKSLFIDPGRWALIPTGIIIRLPLGIEAQIRPRSGIALKHGVTVLNSPGTIDAGYRGEFKIILINLGTKRFFINDGDRIAQICFNRIKQTELIETIFEQEEENPQINSKIEMEIMGNRIQRRGMVNTHLSKGMEPHSTITKNIAQKYLSKLEFLSYNTAIRSGNSEILRKYTNIIAERIKDENP